MDKKIEDKNFEKFSKSKINEILELISFKNPMNNLIITGGHFRIFFNKSGFREEINSGTIKSFELALKMYLTLIKKNISANLGILINDMGSACDEGDCYIEKIKFLREKYFLPSIYKEILTSAGLGPNHCKTGKDIVKVFWEKHIRNTAKKEFIKILKHTDSNPIESKKDHLTIDIKKEPSGFYIEDPRQYGKIMLTRTQGKDKYGTPACPLIMAGLNIMQSKQKYSMCLNFYYVGQDNILNIPNYFVIEKGKRVTELFGYNIEVKNIYFDKF